MPLLLLLVLPLIWQCNSATPCFAQGGEPDTTPDESVSKTPGSRVFPPRISTLGLIYLPKARYTTETGLGFGGKIFRKFRWFGGQEGDPLSDVSIKGLYTLKGQKRSEIVARIYLPGGRYYVKTKLEYDDFALRFWGLGPNSVPEFEETYRPRSVLTYIEFFRSVLPQFKIGLRYEYQTFRIDQQEPGSRLIEGVIPGVCCRKVSGAGILLDWDTRDRSYSPRRGNYYQFFSLWFTDEIGSDNGFNIYHFDLRNYFPVGRQHVLATELFLYSAMGDAPFWRLAALGGRHHTRGYRRGRYLDHSLLAVQAEYRFPIAGRFGMVTFAGLGMVAPGLDRFQLEYARPSAGLGLRYQPKQDDPLKMRLDVGFGQESVRLYLSIDEAY
jgi:outer membrane protein assembly factor BamA